MLVGSVYIFSFYGFCEQQFVILIDPIDFKT